MTAGAWLFRRGRPAARSSATPAPRNATAASPGERANGWLDSADALRHGAEIVECGSDVGDALLHEFFDTVIDGSAADDATRH